MVVTRALCLVKITIRDKVYELHSKTTKVNVNGIQQRFCQQCTRFHLLSEFDDGKRSFRKRLSSHNERGRKPYCITRDANSKFKGSQRSRAQSSSMWSIKLKNEMANDLRSMSSITDVQLQYPPPHGSDSFFCPITNKDLTGGTDNFIMKSPTPALSLLSSQSDGASSCHSSRKSSHIAIERL